MDTAPPTENEILLEYLQQEDVTCPGCRYNLRGLRVPKCPECGHELKLRLCALHPPHLVWNASLMLLLFLAGVGAFSFLILYMDHFRYNLSYQDVFTELLVIINQAVMPKNQAGALACGIAMLSIPLPVAWIMLRRRVCRRALRFQWGLFAVILAVTVLCLYNLPIR